jgi:hypothetical protein
MKGKALLIMITLIGMVFGGKIIWQKFQEFLQFLTVCLTSSIPPPEIGIVAGLGVALFAILLILLLIFVVAILQFVLSRP